MDELEIEMEDISREQVRLLQLAVLIIEFNAKISQNFPENAHRRREEVLKTVFRNVTERIQCVN